MSSSVVLRSVGQPRSIHPRARACSSCPRALRGRGGAVLRDHLGQCASRERASATATSSASAPAGLLAASLLNVLIVLE